jgi:demethylmenaquinone methyltransferase/2-methoxy-6-polyprenyl-1,4-benzoquinol methylase
MSVHDVLADQVRYYRARAPEYDDAYRRAGRHDRGAEANAAWLDNLALLRGRLQGAALAGEIVEVAAGTGYWTAALVEQARSVTAIDAAPEALAANRRRLGKAASEVDYIVADLFNWRTSRSWDGCAGFFWLCHVPDERLGAFLAAVRTAIRPGGRVFFGDKLPAAPQERWLEERTVADGRRFAIVNRLRSAAEYERAFGSVGLEVEASAVGDRFVAIVGHRPTDR